MESLVAAVKSLQQDGWNTASIVKPHTSFIDKLDKAPRHDFALDKIPAQAGAPVRYLRPDLRVYAASSGFDAEIKPFDRWVAADYISDTLVCAVSACDV